MLDGETILGEKENITEGLDGSFSLTLEEGEYTIRCNGGEDEDGTLKVSGKLQAANSPEVDKAIAQYRAYLEENAEELTAQTKPFIAAVIAGDVKDAKDLYPAARIPYERIEPVAESFGDLDPRIDARANDVPAERMGRLPPDRESALGRRHREGHGAGRRSSCWPTSKNWKRK